MKTRKILIIDANEDKRESADMKHYESHNQQVEDYYAQPKEQQKHGDYPAKYDITCVKNHNQANELLNTGQKFTEIISNYDTSENKNGTPDEGFEWIKTLRENHPQLQDVLVVLVKNNGHYDYFAEKCGADLGTPSSHNYAGIIAGVIPDYLARKQYQVNPKTGQVDAVDNKSQGTIQQEPTSELDKPTTYSRN